MRRPDRPVEVFAVSGHDVQVVVRGAAGASLRIHDVVVPITHRTQAVTATGLVPATAYHVSLDDRPVATFETLPDAGPRRATVATISDLHVGERAFGHLPRLHMSARADGLTHPVLCLRAAVDEINAWGPDLTVVKGDLVHHPDPALYGLVAAELARLTSPALVLPGNHDGGNHTGIPVDVALGDHGVVPVMVLADIDLPGARVVAINSLWPGRGLGRFTRDTRDEALTVVATDQPVLIFVHHQFMTSNLPRYWPPGVLRRHGRTFLDALADANPATLISSGHTHRHRRRRHGPLVLTEVGSIKDHPGTWARYEIFDDAVVQSVRRIEHTDAIEWTETTATSVAGLWGRWSPGRLSDRSFLHRWPAQPGRTAPT